MKSPSRLSVICERIIEAGWLIAVILAPLFFNSTTYRIYDANKIALIQVAVSVMAVAWVIKWLEHHRSNPISLRGMLASPLVLPTLAIVLVQIFTTVTAIAPAVSFVGSFTRPQGASIALSYVALFALMAQGLTTRQQFDRLLATIALASLPVALYGIIQNFGLDPLVWDREIAGRAFANLGNPIFLGGYLIMAFFLTCGRALASAREPGKAAARRAGMYGLIACVQSLGIVFTISRGPWLGWLAGFFFFALLLAFVLRLRRAMQGMAILGIVGVVALAALNVPNTPLEPLRRAPYIGSLGHIFEGESGTGKVRTLIWEADARVFSESPAVQFPDGTPDRLHFIRPLVGYGPDSMSVVYTQFRIADGTDANPKEDHSHNETWDVLVNTGILGLIAYQSLWLCIFFLGLQWLGLATTKGARALLIGLWLGGGLVLGLATIALGQFKYFGVALPLGNLAGVALFLIGAAWCSRPSAPAESPTRPILIAALLGTFTAHYVEIQFGINLTTTHTLFWVGAAMLVVLGAKQLEPTLQAVRQPIPAWIGTASSYALIGALILATLFFEFTQRTNGADPWQTFWLSLTFNSASQQTSYAILALLLGSWATITLVATAEMTSAGISGRGDALKTIAIIAAGSLGPSALFGLGLSARVSALPVISAALTDPHDALRVAEQFLGLADFYFTTLVVFVLLAVLALCIEARWHTFAWANNRRALIAFAPLTLATVALCNWLILAPIRADVYNKVGLFFTNAHETDAAIALFNRALRLAPLEDRYYMMLGNVYANKAFYLDMKNPSQFGDHTRLDDMLDADIQQIAALNRNDAIYAAQTMYLRAYDLNPLLVDHSVNLARLFKPEPPVDTAGKTALAERSTKYYARAVRLAPSDMQLWNEWADFDLTYWENAESALNKLQEAARRDPLYAPTFVKTGDLYKSKSGLDQAIAAYQRALAAKIPPPEAASKLAFIYYQQGNLAAAIANYARYIELAPDAPNLWEAHKNLALLYERSGNLISALREAQSAINLAPAESQSALIELASRLRINASQP
jgi:tetratricopeptide (TPR) repeat protein/O-antigen ligase